MAEIIIDTYQCSGCETCAEMCPDVFRMDEVTEKAALVNVSPHVTDAVRQAAAFCPEKCIEILE
ncbi:MAG: ferredoxin [Candidatus Electrothrix sp. AR1]|nr:ferredoxin [Candidatus Electrothrix sp. AR1]